MPGTRKWISRRTQSADAVFIDRDGVLIEDSGYLSRPEEVRFIPGSAEAIARLNQAGVTVVLVTNQSGIGRRYYGWPEFENVQAALVSGLAAHGAWLDGVWACAYHKDGAGEYQLDNHPWRKPNPGMILDAIREMALVAEKSWMVGDKVSDTEAGLRAGLGGVIHVRTGYGSAGEPVENAAVRHCANLAEAATLILKERHEQP